MESSTNRICVHSDDSLTIEFELEYAKPIVVCDICISWYKIRILLHLTHSNGYKKSYTQGFLLDPVGTKCITDDRLLIEEMYEHIDSIKKEKRSK